MMLIVPRLGKGIEYDRGCPRGRSSTGFDAMTSMVYLCHDIARVGNAKSLKGSREVL